MSESPTGLRRNLTMSQIALYGLGNILGAGIYVLIGEIAGIAGSLAPLSFLLAAAVAAFTASSFAEFSARYPVSGGGALYVHKAFNRPGLTVVVGLLMMLTGIVSAATIARGFVGYLDVFINVPETLTICVLLLGLCALASWGIQQSVSTAVAITLIEIFGLLLIVGVANLAEPGVALTEITAAQPAAGANTEGLRAGWAGLLGGSFLAFYAYIGFEDVVNVAEEVKSPRKNMPLAIAIALITATLLYAAATASALLVLTPAELASSDAPLAAVFEAATGNSPWFISIISMFAVINGALIQIIMCSRICYGLAQEALLPPRLGHLNSKTQTPVNATVLVSLIITIAAISLSIETLARFTTTVLLVVFILVNAALLKVKHRDGNPDGSFSAPPLVPVLGILASAGFLAAEGFALIGSL